MTTPRPAGRPRAPATLPHEEIKKAARAGRARASSKSSLSSGQRRLQRVVAAVDGSGRLARAGDDPTGGLVRPSVTTGPSQKSRHGKEENNSRTPKIVAHLFASFVLLSSRSCLVVIFIYINAYCRSSLSAAGRCGSSTNTSASLVSTSSN